MASEETPSYTPPLFERPVGATHGSWGEQSTESVSVSRGLHYYNVEERRASSARHSYELDRRGSEIHHEEVLTEKSPEALSSVASVGSLEDDTINATAPHSSSGDANNNSFDLREWMERRNGLEQSRGIEAKRIGLSWHDVTVLAPSGTSTTFVKTLPRAIVNTFGHDPLSIISGFLKYVRRTVLPNTQKLSPSQEAQMRKIIQGHEGVLKEGEMLLVLGRPGSGCSTFLKAVSSSLPPNLTLQHDSSIYYGGLPASEIGDELRGEVIYSNEEDIHAPTISVAETLKFALKMKVPTRGMRLVDESRSEFVETVLDVFLKMFGISHIRNTIVGDDYVRGVSGGERKRVSIAEVLACRASITCWDNSTRGLDASTALDYARSLKLATKLRRTSATLATLYQVSDTIFDQFDRVLLIDEGLCVYYGPREEARLYFENLGYHSEERQSTADFLTGITDPNEVVFKSGWKAPIPRTAEERALAWKESSIYAELRQEIDEYNQYQRETGARDALKVKDIVRNEKNRNVRKGSRYTVSFIEQVKGLIIKQLLIRWGAKEELYIKYFNALVMPLVVSSLFYNTPQSSLGAFTKGGVIFFSCVFNAWLQMSETIEAVAGRPIIAKHHQFGFHRPSAVVIARAIIDIPLLLVQCFVSSIIIYFMVNLKRDAGAYFVFLLYTFVCSFLLTALFRLFAALSPGFDEVIRFVVLAMNVMFMLGGYVLHRPLMNWTKFITYISGFWYTYEGMMVNEFSSPIPCDSSMIIPFHEARDVAYQTCDILGSQPGSLVVQASAFLRESFDHYQSHKWRNIGVILAFTALYIILTVIVTELLDFSGDVGGVTIFAKTRRAKSVVQAHKMPNEADLEGRPAKSSASLEGDTTGRSPTSAEIESDTQAGSKDPSFKSPSERAIFTFKDLSYSIDGKDLLQNVSGWVKPGQLTALMGASGAGKTTLLTALSQRHSAGVMTGDIRVDGRPLDAGFQKSTGFCLQGDVHLPTATVREAITFSALLRQPREITREQKLADVDNTIHLLELEDLQDALIMGLGVERRKRVTIAVELAAKPELLLFLDEPTSGLDSAGAASIIRLLRKLAGKGQAILVTIHQPSSLLFESFDQLLLLSAAGGTAYFGPVGNKLGDSDVVRSYFESNGAPPCPPSGNVAEYMLEVVSGDRTEKRIDWNERWNKSIQADYVRQAIDDIVSERSTRPANTDPRLTREYSSPLLLQIVETTKRQFVDMYRDPSYVYGVLFSNVVIGLAVGLAFQHLGSGLGDTQNKTFSSFVITLNMPAVINAVMAKFFELRGLYETREGPSKTYSWVAFMTAMAITSLPLGLVSSVIYFLPSFFIPFYSRSSTVAGFIYFLILLFNLYEIFFAFALAAAVPTPTAAANLLPFMLPFLGLCSGVIVPHSTMLNPWKDFVYWVMPTRYYISSFNAAIFHNTPIQCNTNEIAVFNPPPGQTCGNYAGSWVSITFGYLIDYNATSSCQYCTYSTGDQYLETLNIEYSHKWRDFGIFLVYVVAHIVIAYLSYYLFRVRKGGLNLFTRLRKQTTINV